MKERVRPALVALSLLGLLGIALILFVVYDVLWTTKTTYGQMHLEDEKQFSKYNFELADVNLLRQSFTSYEAEAKRLLAAGLVKPAYEQVMKCSHAFNLLDARGAISVSERVTYIGRVRAVACAVAQAYYKLQTPEGVPA